MSYHFGIARLVQAVGSSWTSRHPAPIAAQACYGLRCVAPLGPGTFGPLGADEAMATVAAKAVARIEAVSALRPQRGHNNEAHSKLAQLWVAKAGPYRMSKNFRTPVLEVSPALVQF
jgi:hypothetical protein